MAAEKDPNQDASIVMPLGGKDTSASYDGQRSGTSAFLQNVRPFDCRLKRRRLSRRPGEEKYCSVQLGTAPGQDLNYLIVNRDQSIPAGDCLSAGATIPSVAVYEKVAGGSAAADLSLGGSQSLACIDNDLNWYVADVVTGGTAVQLKQINSSGTLVWTVTMTVTGTGTGAKLWGLGSISGVVYVWVIDASATGIFRFSAEDGSRMDPGAWLSTASGLVSATAVAVRSYQCMAIGGSLIGVVGGLNSKLVVQAISTTTGAITYSTVIQDPFESYEARIVSDQGGNYYILDNAGALGTFNHLHKISWGGEFPASFHGGAKITSTTNTATDICYEPTTFAICVVGSAVFPNVGGVATADDSFQQWAAFEGTLAARSKPGGFNWSAVCADGLGSVRLRRSAAGANNLTSITANGATTNWAIDTGAPTSTQFLWVQCTGTNLSPLPSTMRPTRVTRVMAVGGGVLRRITRTTAKTISSTFMDGGAAVISSTVLNDKLFYIDGSNYKYYDGELDTAVVWAATTGIMPVSANGLRCRLSMTHNGRIYLAGLPGDDQNMFACRQFEPFDWNYSVDPEDVAQAFAGNNAPIGQCPDKINGMVSWRDDLAWFLCNRSIWQLTGDPADGGIFRLISADTGGAFGRAFCFDPDGTLYFMGNQGVVFRAQPGGKPQEISSAVQQEMRAINLGTSLCRMVWDHQYDGFHLYVSPLDPTQATTNYWWDAGKEVFSPQTKTTGAYSWWPDVHANVNHNPMAILMFDGDDPDDRVLLKYGRDGYVRQPSDNATGDDGVAIEAIAYSSPLAHAKRLAFTIKDIQVMLGQQSSDISWGWKRGESVEAAVNNPVGQTGTSSLGRNMSRSFRWTQHVGILEISTNVLAVPWSVERVDSVIEIHPPGPAQRIFYPSTPGVIDNVTPPVVTPPASGTAFDPSMISSFTLWIKGDDASISSLNDGDPVTSWTNRGSAGGVVQDIGSGNNPSYQVAELNSKGVVRFDGANDVLGGLTIGSYTTAAANSVFIVLKCNQTLSDIIRGPWTDAAFYFAMSQSAAGVMTINNWDGGPKAASIAGVINTWELYSTSLGGGTLSIRRFGGTAVTAASGDTQNTAGVFYLGRYGGTGFAPTDIAEMLIANTVLSDSDRQLVEGFLAWKYGLQTSLDAAHPWRSTPPVV